MITGIVTGILIGITLAYLDARRRSRFREKLFLELESQGSEKAIERHIAGIVKRRAQWIKSISIVRKPFNKPINLMVETAALLLASLALINSVVNFDKNFTSPAQGLAVVAFLSLVVSFVPSEWFLNGKVDKDIEAVMDEMEKAMEDGKLKAFLTEAKKNWGRQSRS